jgi:hypothetical protein
MRWVELFEDLAAQADALERLQRQHEVSDRYRIELGEITLARRLAGATGRPVRLELINRQTIGGVIERVARDWLLLHDSGRDNIVTVGAVLTVRGLGRAAPVQPGIDARLGIRSALRAVARDRSVVSVELMNGSTITGVLDRVGADHVDVGLRPLGERRANSLSADTVAVALGSIASIGRRVGEN